LLDTFLARRRAEEEDTNLITVFSQFGECGRWYFTTLKHVILRFDYRFSLRDVFVGERLVADEVFSAIILKLHPIRSGFRRRINAAMGQMHVAIVIDSDLGD
jgi:hypothetical protein